MPRTITIAAAAALIAGHLPAAAQGIAPSGQPESVAAPFAAPKLAESDLQAIAGREDTTQVATNDQLAGVSQNSVGDNVVTGEVRIDGNAFQNMSGLSILNINTGNNVAINAAMNVNISITPGQ